MHTVCRRLLVNVKIRRRRKWDIKSPGPSGTCYPFVSLCQVSDYTGPYDEKTEPRFGEKVTEYFHFDTGMAYFVCALYCIGLALT